MPRATKNYAQAVERALPFLPDTMKVERVSYGWVVKVKGLEPVTKSARDVLTLIAVVLQRLNHYEAREEIAYHGRIPYSGLADWQECALEWLHIDPPEKRYEGNIMILDCYVRTD